MRKEKVLIYIPSYNLENTIKVIFKVVYDVYVWFKNDKIKTNKYF